MYVNGDRLVLAPIASAAADRHRDSQEKYYTMEHMRVHVHVLQLVTLLTDDVNSAGTGQWWAN